MFCNCEHGARRQDRFGSAAQRTVDDFAYISLVGSIFSHSNYCHRRSEVIFQVYDRKSYAHIFYHARSNVCLVGGEAACLELMKADVLSPLVTNIQKVSTF